MFGQQPQNPNNLIVIKTARTLDEINSAAAQGMRPLIKWVKPSSEIHYGVSVYQNRRTGYIKAFGGIQDCPRGYNYDCVLPFRYYYPYIFPSPFAAYLVPPDLRGGQRIWLDDVIEDIVAVHGNDGYHPRLKGCEAIWSNGDFKIQFYSEEDARQRRG